ncbi:uncharacterized protein N0V89_007947 [Didymosphaeria variabile]|uniref:N-acetyltransferase domain-containing protein n=1 Tax=Didymosphaeria variabile TaxID=1932322 RepID=A0A9W8XFH6_9PLEO|nr:uncharacterized protein N0V89_007947 [Didymosphaeria variabile]KAJ4349333.1 hypothetical protein N0V89_007947 [Didymosphaeria variabile]
MSSNLEIAKPLRKITDPSEIPRFAAIVAAAFSQDALNRYLFMGRESNPEHPKIQTLDDRKKYWEAIIQPRFEGGAILVEFPPGVEKKPHPAATVSEGVAEYLTFYKALKEEKLGSRPHWHLNIIGRDPERSDKGAVTAIFEPFLAEAKAKNIPVWLESTNAHAKGVYEYFGFKVVGQIRIGKGIAGSDGWVKEGGDGVETWGMIAGLDGW